METYFTTDALPVQAHAASLVRDFRIRGFKQKIKVYIEKGNYIIKTAENRDEVLKAIRLRTEVFLEELNGRDISVDLDIDEYDVLSDHLLLMEKETGNVVGTYRFNSNLYSNSFYSETEFDIFNILTLPGIKVELGRACIHKNFRGGVNIGLLFTGIIQYAKAIRADYFFGCSSFHLPETKYAAQLNRYFMETGKPGEDMMVYPRKKYSVQDLDLYIAEMENSGSREYLTSRRFIPGLVNGYISAGAVICGEPVYDADFNCYDFFTLLDLKKMDMSYVSRLIR